MMWPRAQPAVMACISPAEVMAFTKPVSFRSAATEQLRQRTYVGNKLGTEYTTDGGVRYYPTCNLKLEYTLLVFCYVEKTSDS